MKRVIGIFFVLILAIALGLAAEELREGGVSMVSTYRADDSDGDVSMVSAYRTDGSADGDGSLPHRSDYRGSEVSRED